MAEILHGSATATAYGSPRPDFCFATSQAEIAIVLNRVLTANQGILCDLSDQLRTRFKKKSTCSHKLLRNKPQMNHCYHPLSHLSSSQFVCLRSGNRRSAGADQEWGGSASECNSVTSLRKNHLCKRGSRLCGILLQPRPQGPR